MENTEENLIKAKEEITKIEDNQIELGALHLLNLAVVPGVNITCDIKIPEEIEHFSQIFNRQENVVLLSPKDIGNSKISKDNIFEIGCLAQIEGMQKLANGGIKTNLHGVERVKIVEVKSLHPLVVKVEILKEINTNSEKSFEKMSEIKQKCRNSMEFRQVLPMEVENKIMYGSIFPGAFADALTHVVTKNIREQQEILAELDVEKRLDLIDKILTDFLNAITWKQEIDEKVNSNLAKAQKEMFLREQLKVINEELNGDVDEIEDFKEKVKSLNLPKEHEEKVLKEINKLAKLPFGSPEVGYIRNFLETVLELPWTQKTEDNLDLDNAKKVLDADHYALDKVKERILQSLAVMKLTGKVSRQIICLVGPPGVGKTSIARSIARAMGRNFVQVSLGGVSDESVIRGHRRTYVGAMCGRILAGMKQAKTINPVFLLDEIDKLTRDIRGDPSSALLEVLDPEQNDHFKDNFLELSYDLSQVLFIITANTLETIPKPLLDRMEIIELRSYTEIEKIHIAERYLIEKQEKLCGLKKGTVPFTREILSKIINEYTYEAGVRNLEREIATICRIYASVQAGKEQKPLSLETLPEYLGNDFIHEIDMFEGGNVGEVVGLSVTSVGIGHPILIETTIFPGEEKIVATGKFGEMMKESAQASYSLVKSRAFELGIDQEKFKNNSLHVHVPHVPGGVEGPSAGIAMTTAIVSSFLGKKVKPHLAMTGEISLRGRVLPIGGVRDKLIGAARVGVKTIIMPKDNEKDLKEVPKEIRKELDIHLVTDIKEVLKIALEE